MNKQRRAALGKLQERINELKTEAEALRDEEQDAFDNMPESLQESERGEAAQEALEYLECLVSSLDEAYDYCGSAAD